MKSEKKTKRRSTDADGSVFGGYVWEVRLTADGANISAQDGTILVITSGPVPDEQFKAIVDARRLKIASLYVAIAENIVVRSIELKGLAYGMTTNLDTRTSVLSGDTRKWQQMAFGAPTPLRYDHAKMSEEDLERKRKHDEILDKPASEVWKEPIKVELTPEQARAICDFTGDPPFGSMFIPAKISPEKSAPST